MMEQTFLIISEYGVHARPATRLVNLAMSFNSDISLTALGKTVNLKSIMGLMSLGIYKGEIVKISVTGSDAEKAIVALSDFMITEGLGRLA
ncbi:HPr family phosphocarrier protein [Mariniplasma sp. M4Ah]|uniref:Phosphocarrier protein HPr n=2 Tax=Peloplasma aerotolerans TaxID=3044389 RepID=A0AAW6U7C4_9MOLU|nr:HPr family phosphocarrier protein [Mariniplasma sp. M4Ah]MDI6451968.1 HPr family phosphocarrier protein [Mariniplasma sp. M4Ah]MDR4969249.1 HPr family phosphocarrier protein [Acholeplasmataceae bacterium]